MGILGLAGNSIVASWFKIGHQCWEYTTGDIGKIGDGKGKGMGE